LIESPYAVFLLDSVPFIPATTQRGLPAPLATGSLLLGR